MKFNDTNATTASYSQVKAIYRCALSPHFSWNPDDIITRWCTMGINSVAFIPTILLNLLIVIVVTHRKKLRSKCTILLSSLAVAGLLIGALSQPLYIISHGFLRQVGPVSEQFCTVIFTYQFISYLTSVSSLYHLTIIAWERCTAIKHPYQYKTIVTKDLVKKLLVVIWIAALLSTSPDLLGFFSIHLNLGTYILLVTFLHAPVFVACALITYFYVVINIKVRNRPAIIATQVNTIAKANLEAKVARNTALLTAAVFICYSPNLLLTFDYVSSGFVDSPYLLWTSTLAHLNSLVNPLLYFYRDYGLRIATLALLRIRVVKNRVVQPAAGGGRNTAWQSNPEFAGVVHKSACRLGLRPRLDCSKQITKIIHPGKETPKSQRSQSAPPCLEANASADNYKCRYGLINPKISVLRAKNGEVQNATIQIT